MKLSDFKQQLRPQPNARVIMTLPDGSNIPAHFHVTEVGHVAKNFVDCGGRLGATESCVLQVWLAGARDDGHRLTAGKISDILGFAEPLLGSSDLPVEVEYEDGLVSQFPVEALTYDGSELIIRLRNRHTACLARERCENDRESRTQTNEEAACCGAGVRCCG